MLVKIEIKTVTNLHSLDYGTNIRGHEAGFVDFDR